jgi:hypothetical protein
MEATEPLGEFGIADRIRSTNRGTGWGARTPLRRWRWEFRHTSALLVPEREGGSAKRLPYRQCRHASKLRPGFVTLLKAVVGHPGAEMMHMVEADVSSQPLQKATAASDRSCPTMTRPGHPSSPGVPKWPPRSGAARRNLASQKPSYPASKHTRSCASRYPRPADFARSLFKVSRSPVGITAVHRKCRYLVASRKKRPTSHLLRLSSRAT